jgi:hypothetical protein
VFIRISRLPRILFRLVLPVCITFLLIACGGGGGSSGGGGNIDIITITGLAMKGPVKFAAVIIYVLNSDGSKGDVLGTAQTSILGNISFVTLDSTPTGFVLVEVSGGSYADEALGIDDAFSADSILSTVFADLPTDVNLVAVTPLTSMVAARVRALAATGVPMQIAIDSSNIAVGQQFGVDNVGSLFPTNAADINVERVGKTTRAQRNYGLVLGGISELARSLGIKTIDLAKALEQDIANDGLLDGLDDGAAITVPLRAGGNVALNASAGTTGLQTALNTFVASKNNKTNLIQHYVSTAAVPVGLTSGSSLSITSTTLPAWTEGENGSATLTAIGGTPPYTWAVTTGSLPAWLSMSTAGVFSGTPPLLGLSTSMTVSAPFTVTLTDSADPPQTRDLQLSVTVVKAPPTVSLLTFTAPVEGELYSQQLIQGSGGSGPYYYTLETAGGFPPLGLALSPDGFLSGTPSSSGTSDFSVCAVDQVGSSTCQNISMTVQPGAAVDPTASFNGNWSGPATQTDAACDYSGAMIMVLAQSGSSLSGTIALNLTLVADKMGFCSATSTGPASPLSGSVIGSSFSFNVTGISFNGEGSLSGGTLSGTTTVSGAGITTTGVFSLTK